MITDVKHLELNQFLVGQNVPLSDEICWRKGNMSAQGDKKFGPEAGPRISPDQSKGLKCLFTFSVGLKSQF